MKLLYALHIVLGTLIILNSACTKEIGEPHLLVFGHAGMSLAQERALYPPNSEKSIFYALDVLNADGVEVDVQMTADSVLIVVHDLVLEADDYKNLNEDQCVPELLWSDIENLNSDLSHPILKLSTILERVVQKGKLIQLDVRHYNQCADNLIDFELFNRILEQELIEFSDFQKGLIIVNCRSIKLLDAIKEPLIIKSFESEKIDLAIDYYQGGLIDLLTTKLGEFTAEKSSKLKTAGLDYYLYNVKTKKEIKAAAKFSAAAIIADNIAATKAHIN